MHPANRFYGHAKILARYAGLPRPFMIWGYLQHGWNILDGFAVGTKIIPGSNLFVWSDSVVRRGWSMGLRNYKVIGAAWLYLLELEAERPLPVVEREGTIFYPFHGWEGQKVTGDHQRMMSELREVEDGPLTVCLYWNEYEIPEVRRLYENAGCRVICHGQRGYDYKGTDERFLYKQRAEMLKHKRVVSNRLSSSILYGASLGASVGVYGDPMVLENEHPSFGGVARLKRLWPDMHVPFVPPEIAREFALEELGARNLASPAEIRNLFRWPDPDSLVRKNPARHLQS